MLWQDGMIAFLILWLVVLAWLGFADGPAMLLTGAAVVALGIWRTLRSSDDGRNEEYAHRHDMGLYAE